MPRELKEPEELKIKDLYTDHYIIPIYQRNYAWGVSEVNQLIQDIVDSSTRRNVSNEHINYYIGTLVVFEREQENKTVFETIDGQQRLTTLSILLSAIKNEYAHFITAGDESKDALGVSKLNSNWFKLSIEFESRVVSTETLKIIKENGMLDSLHGEHYNSEIRTAYEISIKALKKILKNDKEIKAFCDYLFHYVVILRVSVPKDTNLNHYFEIMNSRGEQLEKHEIVKERCLKVLESDKSISHAFALIWEACSNMDKYVQYGFKSEQRTKIFGDEWDSLKIENIVELASISFGGEKRSEAYNEANQKPPILKDLLAKKTIDNPLGSNSQDIDASSERFNSVINFPNFLLHVLMIQIGQKDIEFVKANIALDDKRLLDFFKPLLENEAEKFEFVKQFGFNLLKCRFLFDRYIIKREMVGSKSDWSLKHLKYYSQSKNVNYLNSLGSSNINEGENKSLIMLLSMFHVSLPTQNYKYWLNAALKYLFQAYDNEGFLEIKADAYKNYLEDLANAFLRDRFLAVDGKRFDYLEIIYTNKEKSKNILITDIDLSLMDKGTGVENFIFNYLDYLLWSKDVQKYDKFRFTFRSSVEHYYPQNPKEGDNLGIDSECVDNFGNLCLISSSKNSMYSNNMPYVKLSSYSSPDSIDSIKQKIMMDITQGNQKNERAAKNLWGKAEIETHATEMKKILLPDLYVE